ncbi:hypothetical protein [Flavobacterium cerinum]|uniref:Uncharacterized protein n=1 Tax=Flavobacterium cerinum TaxID=2502784 RepID=A0A444HAZ2_9FLAO|nr:hypothetical protein [Flavobacterium cerinum]RWX00405.1 hypothetical protein EPI11_09000 [Flavobacterium cerinum]
MGFFNNVWKAVGEVVDGDFEGAYSEITGNGGEGSKTNRQKAEETVLAQLFVRFTAEIPRGSLRKDQWHRKIMQASVAYLQSAEGQKMVTAVEGQLNSGLNANGGTIQNIVKDIVNTAVGSVKTGVSGTIEKGFDKGIEKLFGTKPIKKFEDTLGGFLGNVADSAISQWFKKNWYWVVVPVCAVGYFLFRPQKAYTSGGKGPRTK